MFSAVKSVEFSTIENVDGLHGNRWYVFRSLLIFYILVTLVAKIVDLIITYELHLDINLL